MLCNHYTPVLHNILNRELLDENKYIYIYIDQYTEWRYICLVIRFMQPFIMRIEIFFAGKITRTIDKRTIPFRENKTDIFLVSFLELLLTMTKPNV